uniref:BED-type domain-containing protein n=1 Tax=Arundo donax TaxID=35708 RepID=A0A0A9DTN8_ARUDO
MASSSSATATASTTATSSVRSISDIRAPLWDFVTLLGEKDDGGGNVEWKCNYCNAVRTSSYTRVEAHLLQRPRQGIAMCKKVKIEDQNEMRKTVAEAKERVERSKQKMVSLPTSTNSKKKRSGPISALEKAWKMDQRKHLDALIGRAFYSGGMQCKLQNMYISIKCSTTAVILQYCFLC